MSETNKTTESSARVEQAEKRAWHAPSAMIVAVPGVTKSGTKGPASIVDIATCS